MGTRRFIPQTSFGGGQFSPVALGRFDTRKYLEGAARCKNFRILIQGPVTRRVGTRHLREVKNSANRTILVPFIFSNTDSYGLEVGNTYARVIKNQAYVSAVTGSNLITNGDFPTDITSWTNSSVGTGSIAHNTNLMDITSVDASNYGKAEQSITVVTGKQYQISVDVGTGAVICNVGTTSGGNQVLYEDSLAVGSGQTLTFYAPATTVYVQFHHTTNATHTIDNVVVKELAPIEFTTPWTSAQLDDVTWTQSESTLYMFHSGVKQRKITRTSDSVWNISEWTKTDGPYLPQNKTTTTLQASAATGTSVTITASAVTGINGGSGFKSTDVGRILRIQDNGNWGAAEITGFTDTTHVTVNVDTINDAYGPDIDTSFDAALGASTKWRLGVWGDDEGWPEVGFTHGGRMYLGRNTDNPNTIWASESDDFESYQPTSRTGTVTDSHAFSATLDSNENNGINWMEASNEILLGTAGAVWRLFSGDVTSVITPTSRESKRASGINSAKAQAKVVGKGLLFLSASREKIRDLFFDFATDSFDGADLTLLSEDSGDDLFKAIDFEEEPVPTVWAYTDNGQLWAAVIDKNEEIVGFTEQELGGSDVKVKSLIVLPNSTGRKYNAHLIVERTIDGGTVQYVEYIEDAFNPSSSTDIESAFFLDSGLTYNSTSTTEIRGLYHLRGETVQIVSDGGAHSDKTVTAQGGITLDEAGSHVHVGYHYDSDLRLLPLPDQIDERGSIRYRTKRCVSIKARFLNTKGGRASADETNWELFKSRKATDPMDSSPPLFTGNKHANIKGDSGEDAQVTIQQNAPFPMTILGVMREVDTSNE